MAKFQKGQSGNPGGRKKIPDCITNLAKDKSKRAMERLVEWMEGDDPRASVRACEIILERAWGKPVQAVSGPDGGPIQITWLPVQS